jgi:hypothetical protein
MPQYASRQFENELVERLSIHAILGAAVLAGAFNKYSYRLFFLFTFFIA